MRFWKANACDRATQWLSLELDGELSQLEEAALERHLDGCARCRAVSDDVRAFTAMLREAPLVELERPLVALAPRRARTARRVTAALAFAGVVAAAAIGGFVPGGNTDARSALTFRSAQEQQRFAEVETQRLEPTDAALGDTRCIGNCALG
jgi:predicted anti-sigma-YlaC factor YlaD